MAFRNTPRANGNSPAQLLFGCQLRTSLPFLTSAYEAPATAAAYSDKASHDTASCHQWRGVCTPIDFGVGESVLVKDPVSKEWNGRGTIKRPHNNHSFDICMIGALIRSNEWFLSHAHSLPSDLSPVPIKDPSDPPHPTLCCSKRLYQQDLSHDCSSRKMVRFSDGIS
jgi:hypothetical protein